MITLPRMGMVTYGEIRRKMNRRTAIFLTVFVLVLVALVLFTSLGTTNSHFGSWLSKILGEYS